MTQEHSIILPLKMKNCKQVIVLSFISAIIIAGLLLIGFETFKEVEPEEKFKVVDTYKNCNVIRYTDPSSRWHYFLRCST